MISNDKVRQPTQQRTQQRKPDDIIRERLRWSGHVRRMSADIPARGAVSWFHSDAKGRQVVSALIGRRQ